MRVQRRSRWEPGRPLWVVAASAPQRREEGAPRNAPGPHRFAACPRMAFGAPPVELAVLEAASDCLLCPQTQADADGAQSRELQVGWHRAESA